MRTHPSHIHTTPHPDGPQRLSELMDVDVFKVDRASDTKVYGFRYTDEPDEHGRFWILQEFGEEIFTDELVKIGPDGDAEYLHVDWFEYLGPTIIISTLLSITNVGLGLQLVNDSDAAIVDMYQFYGMDPAGLKGRYILDASFTYYDDSVTNLGDTVQIAIDNLWALVEGDALFQYPAAFAVNPDVPTARPDGTDIRAGDRWEVTITTTIVGLDPYDALKPGDTIVAREDIVAGNPADVTKFYSMQGNIDAATLLQAREGTEQEYLYMTPRTNVERIEITDLAAQANIIDESDRFGADYAGSVAGIYKRQRWNDLDADYTYRYDGRDLRRTYNSQTITGKFTIFPGLPTTIAHNLGSRNYHIDFFQDGAPVELEVEELERDHMIVRAVTPGNYVYSITRTPDSEILGRVSTLNGQNSFLLESFTAGPTMDLGNEQRNMLFMNGIYYVTDSTNGRISRYTEDFVYIDSLVLTQAGLSPINLQHISTDYEHIYVTGREQVTAGPDTYDSYLFKINISAFTINSMLATPDYPVIPIIVNDFVYVSCYDPVGGAGAGQVIKVDKTTMLQVGFMSVPNAFYTINTGNNLLVTDYVAGTIYRLDLSNFNDVAGPAAAVTPAAAWPAPNRSLGNFVFFRDKIFVAGYGAYKIFVIDPLTLAHDPAHGLVYPNIGITTGARAPWKINRFASLAAVSYYRSDVVQEFDLIAEAFVASEFAVTRPTGVDFF